MDKKFTGTAYVTADGERYATIPKSAKLSPGGVNRTPVVLDGGIVGFTETPVHAEIECEIAMTADIDILKINKATNITIVFQADSGQNYMVRNSALMEPLKHEPEKTPAKFFGAPAEKI